jgi:hypothetical protein
MKNATLRQTFRQARSGLRTYGCVVLAALLLSVVNRSAGTTVTSLGGGPNYYANDGTYYGSTNSVFGTLYSQFHTPSGIALDGSGNYLYVADRDNNAIRYLDLAGGYTYTFTTNLINRPVGVAVDASGNVFVLNQGSTNAAGVGTNGNVLEFDTYGDLLATNSGSLLLTNAAGIALDVLDDIYVTVNSNTLVKIAGTNITTVVTIAAAGTSLQGIVVKHNGLIAACDSGRDGIYLIDPSTGIVTTNAGFNGAGDGTGVNNRGVPNASAQFFQPSGVAEAGDGSLIVADYGNNRVKVVTASGITTNLFGVSSNLWWSSFPGWSDGTVLEPDQANDVQARLPFGVAFAPDGTVYVTEDYYHIIRHVTGAGLQLPPPPPPQVTTPQIGYVDFPSTSSPVPYTSVFHAVSSFVFNNDPGYAPIIIEGIAGSQTYYTYGPTPAVGSIPDPTHSSFSAPVGYEDGLTLGQVSLYAVASVMPDLTIKAIGEKNDGSPNSAIALARFQFIAGNPVVTGADAAQFTINDITTSAQFLYTTDGSDPRTNINATTVGPVSGTNGITLSLQFPANTNSMLFQIVAFKANYQTSSVVSAVFSTTNFVANSISFGFASGEASSAFIASPGQTFYAPVTLSTLSGTVIDSLQFNLTVTNAGPNPGPAITPGAFGFESYLEKPDPSRPGYYLYIPPYAFADSSTVVTNGTVTNQIVQYEGTNFLDLETTNLSINLLGVGWLERKGQTNLYDTKSQDLITYSQAHDDPFPNTAQPNEVVLGGYSFQVPLSATAGQTYQIQIDRPSATTDGIGDPGSSVFIFATTNGSLAGGALNSIKNVTLGQFQYIVGDCAPFRWFNAGDFGDTNVDNSDVDQVFEAAAYYLNSPSFQAPGSDFFDSMDSCGTNLAYLDSSTGFYTNSSTAADLNSLFGGNNTTINNMAYGDGQLDVCDVYVTFRRSEDPTLTWFSRFWTNGVRVAVTTSNVYNESVVSKSSSPVVPQFQPAVNPVSDSVTNQPKVNFIAGDFQPVAGQVIQVPITAQIFGSYPLRVLMLNLTVVPLDGSPAITTPVQFTPNSALGASYTTDSKGNGNYSAVWLNSAIAGLTGTASIGTLTVTIPASATASSAYAIHFDHASASPNGLASFPRQTLTGLITLSSRTNSSYGDGIPDSWRLRYFGTVNNELSVSNADADGDGANNWQEYVAGTDPTDPASCLRAGTDQSVAQNQQDSVIYWPSVSGKQYVIERSASLFPGAWTPISTNNGTGTDMEIHDASGGSFRYYRVRVQ